MVTVAGVDVGKANLDVSVAEGPVIRFDNTAKGIARLLKYLRNKTPPRRCANPPTATNDCWSAGCGRPR